MDTSDVRRAVEHLIATLAIEPYQLVFMTFTYGSRVHSIGVFDPTTGEYGDGFGSCSDVCGMVSRFQVSGGIYISKVAEPPELPNDELTRWSQVFEEIHRLIHSGWTVRVGQILATVATYGAAVEQEVGKGVMFECPTLLKALETAIEDNRKICQENTEIQVNPCQG